VVIQYYQFHVFVFDNDPHIRFIDIERYLNTRVKCEELSFRVVIKVAIGWFIIKHSS
jgi:hypothetical protein